MTDDELNDAMRSCSTHLREASFLSNGVDLNDPSSYQESFCNHIAGVIALLGYLYEQVSGISVLDLFEALQDGTFSPEHIERLNELGVERYFWPVS